MMWKNCFVLLLLSLSFCFSLIAQAGIKEATEATCRITNPSGIMGTGVAIQLDDDVLTIITNAHVVEGANNVICEFWNSGRICGRYSGKIIYRNSNGNNDIGIIRAALNSKYRPSVIPIGTQVPPVNSAITSVGVAHGSWPTSFIGSVRGYSDSGATMEFIPTPADGRSGSAIMDKDSNYIVGLLYARNDRDGYGYAMSLNGINKVLTQCGPGGCPINRNINLFGRQVTPPPTPYQQPLVPVQPGDGVDSQARASIAALQAEVARLSEVAKKAEDLGVLNGKATGEALDVAGKALESVSSSGLFDRIKEKVASTAIGAVLSNLGWPALGIGGVVIGVIVFLVKKDIKDLRENGDPLWISKIAEHTKNTVDDRVAEKVSGFAKSADVSSLLADVVTRIENRMGNVGGLEDLLGKLHGLRQMAGTLHGLFGGSVPTTVATPNTPTPSEATL